MAQPHRHQRRRKRVVGCHHDRCHPSRADLLLSYPAAIGATAIERLARTRTDASGTEAALIAALRQSRFRLLQGGSGVQTASVAPRDVLSGEVLHIASTDLPSQAGGTVLFARVALLGRSPLSARRDHAARPPGHPDRAGSQRGQCPGAMVAVRWAEAIYGHVVQHDALNDLKRPMSAHDVSDSDEEALFELATEWAALADGTPNLLQRTRQSANLPNILGALAGAAAARERRRAFCRPVRATAVGATGNCAASRTQRRRHTWLRRDRAVGE